MPKVNVYIPQDLFDRINAHRTTLEGHDFIVSAICQDALDRALSPPVMEAPSTWDAEHGERRYHGWLVTTKWIQRPQYVPPQPDTYCTEFTSGLVVEYLMGLREVYGAAVNIVVLYAEEVQLTADEIDKIS